MSLRIREAEPGDAPAVIAAIRACYGSSYLQPSALEVRALERALASGELRYALAEAAREGLVGQVALERLNAAGLYHHARAVVAPAWRGRGLLRRMSELLLGRDALPADARLVLGTSVTSHTFTQRYNLSAGFQPLGLVLGIHPEQTLSQLPAAPQAGSALLMGLGLRPWRPRRLNLEGPALELARRVCAGLGIPLRAERRARRRAPLEAPLEAGAWAEQPGQVWRLSYGTAARAAALDEPSQVWSAAVRWVELPAEHPDAPEKVAEWTERGFSAAAYLPLAGPSGEDLLRLQRCERPLKLRAIEVADELRPLRDWVWAQHERALRPLVGA